MSWNITMKMNDLRPTAPDINEGQFELGLSMLERLPGSQFRFTLATHGERPEDKTLVTNANCAAPEMSSNVTYATRFFRRPYARLNQLIHISTEAVHLGLISQAALKDREKATPLHHLVNDNIGPDRIWPENQDAPMVRAARQQMNSEALTIPPVPKCAKRVVSLSPPAQQPAPGFGARLGRMLRAYYSY